jgi:alpha-L-fucosidase
MKTSVIAIVMAATLSTALHAAETPPESPQQRDARIAWWKDAKFGLFIHWGLYSQLAGEWQGGYYAGIGEWIMYKARIPLADYESVAKQFNRVRSLWCA